VFWVVVGIALPFEVAIQYIYSLASNNPDSITYGIFGAILGFGENILVILALGYGIKALSNPQLSCLEHIQYHLRDLIVEIFRALGRIAVGLLLIFPGFKRMVYYYFIPYVIQFDEAYKKGEIDVLVECEKLFAKKLWSISGLLILTQSATFAIEVLEVRFNLFTNTVLWVLIFLLGIVVEAYIFLLFYRTYMKTKEKL
jgi:hypothetical protein